VTGDIEERVRDAYRAVAATVQPEEVRSLAGQRLDKTAAPRRPGGLLRPLGAAAAVVALIAVMSALVPTLRHHSAHHQSRPPATGTRAGQRSQLPEFTIVDNDGSSLQVVRTDTGRVTGAVAAPAGRAFTTAAAVAGDRTFLVVAGAVQNQLSAHPDCRTFLYKLALSDTGQPSPLALLPVTAPLNNDPTALAVSADGRVAAFSAYRCPAVGETIAPSQPFGAIYLVSLATGQVTRHWSYTASQDNPTDLSLSADGSQLAFPSFLTSTVQVVRTIATSAPAGTVDAASRVVLRQAGPASMEAVAMSPDGQTLYACTTDGPLSRTLAAYAISDGHRTRVLRTWSNPPAPYCALAVDPSGRDLLVVVAGGAGENLRARPGVLTQRVPLAGAVSLADGRFIPLPLPIGTLQATLAW
jgi:hypothetical protein